MTRRLRSTEGPPLSRVRTAHVAGCTASTLIHSPLQQGCCLKTFILCSPLYPPPARAPAPPFFFASRLSEKRLHNVARSLERIPPPQPPLMDGAHVDNPRWMPLNKSIYHTHLMKAQLGSSQLYKELSSLSTPATPAAWPRAAQAASLVQPDFSPRTVMMIKASNTIVTLFFREGSCGG